MNTNKNAKNVKEDTTTIAAQSSEGNGKPRKRTKFTYPDSFTSWWEAYPKERRLGKQETFGEWKLAGTRLRDERDWTSQEACDYLQGQVEEFAASPAGKRGQYVKHACRWLRSGQYDDDPSAWLVADDSSGGNQPPKTSFAPEEFRDHPDHPCNRTDQ